MKRSAITKPKSKPQAAAGRSSPQRPAPARTPAARTPTMRPTAQRPTLSLQPLCRALGHFLHQREAWGVICLVLGALTLVALTARDQGLLSAGWSLALRQAFGVGAYPVAALLLVAGMILLVQNTLQLKPRLGWRAIMGWELVFFAGLGALHALAEGSPLTLAQQGKRGGWIGWALWRISVPYLGHTASAVLWIFFILLGCYLILGVPLPILWWRVRWAWAQVGMRWRARIVRRRLYGHGEPAAPSAAPTTRGKRSEMLQALTAVAAPARRAKTPPPEPVEPHPSPASAPAGELPSTDLLAPDEIAPDDESDARRKAKVIEETLTAFGVPAEVIEWNRGPVVTQFGVEPGYVERPDVDGMPRRQKVRVNRILALQNDLALALAAAPIRIEAPVPGRSVVGIEVPNDVKSLVGLRGVLEAPQFTRVRSNLRVALGRDVSGQPVVTDLGAMPHLLIAGATGTGKSVCLNALIVSLLMQNTPDQLRLLLIDPKRVEFVAYAGVPHLVAPIVIDADKVVSALRWTVREMEGRYREFARVGARNLAAYNKWAARKGPGTLPIIVVVIDELAELMLVAAEDVERTICRIAQMARATGIHLVLATQRPSVDVVTGLIKANFPARIAFMVTSQVDSRVILDVPGAERLLGRGDMLYMAPDSPKLQRIQGCWVSDDEVRKVVAFWRERQAVASGPAPSQPAAPPWEGLPAQEDEDDGLLNKAIELVRNKQQASASFLQRQMRIGYPRAARLMDQLEQMGIVGPAESGGRTRSVLNGEEQPKADSDRKPS